MIAIISFGVLSWWQWHRAEEKRNEFNAIAQRMAAPPVTPPSDATAVDLEWRRVKLVGEYAQDAQLLVRSRPNNGSNGFWVMSALNHDRGTTWIARGWIAATGVSTSDVTPPPVPPGNVTVTGNARLPEPGPLRAGEDLPPGQITAVDVGAMSTLVADTSQVSAPVTTPWFVMADNDPTLPQRELPQSTDSRNLSYAGQWLLFAAIGVGGWWYFLRREALDIREEDSDAKPAPVSV